jgi:hypothetical protein
MWPGAEHPGGLQQGQVLNDRQLTAAIRNATAEERLAQLADAHRLNPIHMAAILTKLANISKKQPSQGSKPTNVYAMRSVQIRQQLVQKLQHQLILQGCQGHCPRGLANIIWALAKLQCTPDLELVQMLLQGFCNQLPMAVPQVRQRCYMGCNSALHAWTSALSCCRCIMPLQHDSAKRTFGWVFRRWMAPWPYKLHMDMAS